MAKHIEKILKKYVIATLDSPTTYLKSLGWGEYIFTDNIELATKTLSKRVAHDIVYDYCIHFGKTNFVIIPVEITFALIEESIEEESL